MNEERYFNWLCELVKHKDYQNYSMLLCHLHTTPFRSTMKRDENRGVDGVNLRRKAGYFSSKPCSVFEMMAALAVRCEESVMTNVQYGDRTAEWFWRMVVSLGLWQYDDLCYDRQAVTGILDIFLERRYSPDGYGGLFVIPGCAQDLRDVEIWYQAMWYFAEIE